jgi:hypothetical protein
MIAKPPSVAAIVVAAILECLRAWEVVSRTSASRAALVAFLRQLGQDNGPNTHGGGFTGGFIVDDAALRSLLGACTRGHNLPRNDPLARRERIGRRSAPLREETVWFWTRDTGGPKQDGA